MAETAVYVNVIMTDQAGLAEQSERQRIHTHKSARVVQYVAAAEDSIASALQARGATDEAALEYANAPTRLTVSPTSPTPTEIMGPRLALMKNEC